MILVKENSLLHFFQYFRLQLLSYRIDDQTTSGNMVKRIANYAHFELYVLSQILYNFLRTIVKDVSIHAYRSCSLS